MKWEANNKKYKVLGKRQEKKKTSRGFLRAGRPPGRRHNKKTQQCWGYKGHVTTIHFILPQQVLFRQLGHVEARDSESFSLPFYPRIPFCASFGHIRICFRSVGVFSCSVSSNGSPFSKLASRIPSNPSIKRLETCNLLRSTSHMYFKGVSLQIK